MALNLAAGTVLGFLTGLGLGGGSLLMLWLTAVLGMDPGEARAINLLFFLPSAAIACCFRWKQGALKPGKIRPAILAGTAAAAVFSFVGQNLDTEVLKKGFAVLLLFTGVREVMYKPQNM